MGTSDELDPQIMPGANDVVGHPRHETRPEAIATPGRGAL